MNSFISNTSSLFTKLFLELDLGFNRKRKHICQNVDELIFVVSYAVFNQY